MRETIKRFLTQIRFGVPPEPIDPEEHERLKAEANRKEMELEAALNSARREVRALGVRPIRSSVRK